MKQGQIIFVRRARFLERRSYADFFLIPKTTVANRCIVLSDDKKIHESGRYWYKSSKDQRFDNILNIDLNNSVIGEEIRSPRKLFTSKLHLTRIHRNMNSQVPLHKIVCLAIQVKQKRPDIIRDIVLLKQTEDEIGFRSSAGNGHVNKRT